MLIVFICFNEVYFKMASKPNEENIMYRLTSFITVNPTEKFVKRKELNIIPPRVTY